MTAAEGAASGVCTTEGADFSHTAAGGVLAQRSSERARASAWLAFALLATLAACSSAPPRPNPLPPLPSSLPTKPLTAPPAPAQQDGPHPQTPPTAMLMQMPDPQPQVEPIRTNGANKPYEVLGQTYAPMATDRSYSERGLASWYGRKFHGRQTASGEVYDMFAMTAAHKTLPIPSYARVRNPANGAEVIVRVNDRGPFHANRILDLSYTAALKLGLVGGVGTVEITRLTHDDIRMGSWRSGISMATPAAANSGLLKNDPLMELVQRALDSPPSSGGLTEMTATRNDMASAPLPAFATGALAQLDSQALAPKSRSGGAGVPAPPNGEAASRGEAGAIWLQLGAFKDLSNANARRQMLALRAEWLEPLLAVFNDKQNHKVQAGPYASKAQATAAAARMRELLSIEPLLVVR